MPGRVHVSAPGKIILHGEHSVVYGHLALAASLDLRTHITIRPRPATTTTTTGGGESVRIDFADVDLRRAWPLDVLRQRVLLSRPPAGLDRDRVDPVFLQGLGEFLGVAQTDLGASAVLCFFYLYAVLCPDAVALDISVQSDIPIGAGLGSSAALSVCLAAGLSAVLGHPMDRLEICRLALLSEKILHGLPSGVDNSVSTFGGVIQFAGGKVTVLNRLPRLRILLVNTNVSRNTKQLVTRVKDKMNALPQVYAPIMEAIDGISRACLQLLNDMAADDVDMASYRQMESLIDCNQKLLESLGVSHPSLETICRLASEDQLHAKLTGAGGGGFAFVLLPPDVQQHRVEGVKHKLQTAGFTCLESELGVDGVIVETANS